jgi:hypothetical protein
MLPRNQPAECPNFVIGNQLLGFGESPLSHPPGYSANHPEDCSGGNPGGYPPRRPEGYSEDNPEGNADGYPARYWAGYSPMNPESSREDCQDSNSAGHSGNRRDNCPEGNWESHPESDSEDYLPGYAESYSGSTGHRPFCRKAAGAQLLQLDNLTNGLCLGLRLSLPHKVHTRCQRSHIVRPRLQVQYAPAADVEQTARDL